MAREYLSRAHPRSTVKIDKERTQMCALLRERKPAEENGRPDDEKPQDFRSNVELLSSQIGPQITVFPHWRVWAVR